MNKYVIAAASAVATLGICAPVFATTITNVTVNGKANDSVSAGSGAQVTVTYDLNAGDTVQSLSYEFPGSGLPKKCVDVNPDRIMSGTYQNTFTVNVPTSAGTWSPEVKTYG